METHAPPREVIISVQHLSKIYKVGAERVVALHNINLDILTGQVICIIGTSGSGKSTLLNQLAGLEKPTSGKVLIGGRNISAFTEDQLARFRQRHIGFIFQSYNLMPAMTALENVQMPLIFRGVSKQARNKAAKRALKEVGLAERIRHKPNQMSGGQQQRVGIARAFVAMPRIIFADEPTGNLDTRTTIEVMRMMVRMSRENNQTLVIVTHDREIAEYADRIVTIRDGVLIEDKLNKSLADRPEDEQAMLERETDPVRQQEPQGETGATPSSPEQEKATSELEEYSPEDMREQRSGQ